LRELAGADIELLRGSGGVFDITVDGELRFSKAALGRFPTDDDIAALAKG
jgi:predicted Rdx family selenoprotein